MVLEIFSCKCIDILDFAFFIFKYIIIIIIIIIIIMNDGIDLAVD
jgi:hypothetical protein